MITGQLCHDEIDCSTPHHMQHGTVLSLLPTPKLGLACRQALGVSRESAVLQLCRCHSRPIGSHQLREDWRQDTHETTQQGTLIDGVECVRHWCGQDGVIGPWLIVVDQLDLPRLARDAVEDSRSRGGDQLLACRAAGEHVLIRLG
jgi:hypothetical protein